MRDTRHLVHDPVGAARLSHRPEFIRPCRNCDVGPFTEQALRFVARAYRRDGAIPVDDEMPRGILRQIAASKTIKSIALPKSENLLGRFCCRERRSTTTAGLSADRRHAPPATRSPRQLPSISAKPRRPQCRRLRPSPSRQRRPRLKQRLRRHRRRRRRRKWRRTRRLRPRLWRRRQQHRRQWRRRTGKCRRR